MFSPILLVTRSPFGCCWPSPAASGAATPARSPTPGRRAAGARSTCRTPRRCSAVPWPAPGGKKRKTRGIAGHSPATNGEQPWKIYGKSTENLQILPAKNYAKIWENPSSAAKLYILYVFFCRCKLRTGKVFTGEMEEHGKYVEIWQKKWRIEEPPLGFISVI